MLLLQLLAKPTEVVDNTVQRLYLVRRVMKICQFLLDTLPDIL